MGAWIEIYNLEKGFNMGNVAPFMGAWIEIHMKEIDLDNQIRRTFYGCVD